MYLLFTNFEYCPINSGLDNRPTIININQNIIMKKLILITIITSQTFVSFAQTNSQPGIKSENDLITITMTALQERGLEHFKFKDIPIDGLLNNFVDKLKKVNFKVIDITENEALLIGDFAGKKAHVYVQSSSKIVYGVTVIFETQDTWNSLKTQYDNVKSNLKAKYGEPKESTEIFNNSIYEKAGMELYALKEEKCTFRTIFMTENGNGLINLKISSEASVVINYIDSINYLKVSSDAHKDY